MGWSERVTALAGRIQFHPEVALAHVHLAELITENFRRRPPKRPNSSRSVSIAGVNEPVIAAVIEPPVDGGR